MCSFVPKYIFLGSYICNFIKIYLYKNSYLSFMKFTLDRFLCLLLIRSAEIYYGDSLKDLVMTE